MNGHNAYLPCRNSRSLGHVSSSILNLAVLCVLGYLSIWYFQPANPLVNLPYCLSEFFSEDVPLYDPSSGIITGIFVSDRKWSYLSYYHVLRFYEDGMVMSTSVVSRDIEADWRRTSFWFNRQSDRAEDLYGKYEFRDNQIHFTTHRHEDNWIEPLMTDWTGSYFDGKLFLLRIEQHSNGGWTATGTDVFTRLRVDQCPLSEGTNH